jgi:tetratricopeptide (TPR) repeat protein
MDAKSGGRKRSSGSPAKRSSWRDSVILVGAVALVSVLFLVMKSPDEPPKPPVQANQQAPGHGDMGDMMAMLPNLPTDYEGLVGVGNQTMDQGNYAVAAECYKRALALSGSSPDVRTDYGACLHGMGLPDRALQEFRTVLKEHPKHGIATFNMGIVFLGVGESDSAKTYFGRFVEMDPEGSAAEAAKQYLKELGG